MHSIFRQDIWLEKDLAQSKRWESLVPPVISLNISLNQGVANSKRCDGKEVCDGRIDLVVILVYFKLLGPFLSKDCWQKLAVGDSLHLRDVAM